MATKVRGYRRRTKTGKIITVKAHSRSGEKHPKMEVSEPAKQPEAGKEFKRTIEGSTKSPAEIERILSLERSLGYIRQSDLKTKQDWQRARDRVYKNNKIKRTPPQYRSDPPKRDTPQQGDYFDRLLSKIDKIIKRR